jgi:hypothetical protein
VIKRILLACLTALTFVSEAGAVTFSNTQFDVTAIALTDGAPGIDSQSGPPLPTPVSASAASVGVTDVATAGAIGAPGLLTASADASASSGIASAVATSHFSGSFLMSALEPLLTIDFTSLNFGTGSGVGATSLFVSLTSNGVVLFQDVLSNPSVLKYAIAPGGTNFLDLTLTSEASAGFPQGLGDGSTFGQVAIASAVPLPAPWLLLLAGLGPIAAMKKKRAAQAVGAAA